MRKFILFAFTILFTLSASTAFAARADRSTLPDNAAAPDKTENKLSEEELSRLTRRVEEIRDMDKSDMKASEKRELKKELKTIKREIGGTVYIGAGTLILIIILAVLLL